MFDLLRHGPREKTDVVLYPFSSSSTARICAGSYSKSGSAR
jgi:hypothetical protein